MDEELTICPLVFGLFGGALREPWARDRRESGKRAERVVDLARIRLYRGLGDWVVRCSVG